MAGKRVVQSAGSRYRFAYYFLSVKTYLLLDVVSLLCAVYYIKRVNAMLREWVNLAVKVADVMLDLFAICSIYMEHEFLTTSIMVMMNLNTFGNLFVTLEMYSDDIFAVKLMGFSLFLKSWIMICILEPLGL
ncbi:uncharacterized protein [Cherax quadricarinatus]|nr:uncharacterized protein LOC128702272 [Cherax quadricarinatus]